MGVRGKETHSQRHRVPLVPSPAALRLDDEFLVTFSSVTVEFAMREHVPDDRA